MAQKTPSSVSEEELCSVRYSEKRVTFLNIINLFLSFLNLKYVKIYRFFKKGKNLLNIKHVFNINKHYL
jgi:hypothetical protein